MYNPCSGLALDAIANIFTCQQRRRWNDDDPQLHARQERLPECGFVAKHQQQAVAAFHAERSKERRDSTRSLSDLLKRAHLFGAVFLGHHKCAAGISCRHDIDVVNRPVERVHRRPAESVDGSGVVSPMG